MEVSEQKKQEVQEPVTEGQASDTEKKTDARQQASDGEVSETWAHETIQELLDFSGKNRESISGNNPPKR